MARNYIQHGEFLTFPAPAAVASGGVVVAGEIVGVATCDAATGESVDVATVGVFRLPKVAADAIALGDPVYWDGTAELVTTDGADNTRLGVAVEPAGASVGTVAVRLSGF